MEFTENLSKYNKKQVDFIFAMLETGNISKSAKIANITETTAFKYLKNGLSEEINKIRKKYIEESLKLNASKTILDYSLKIREQTCIIEKLNNIEKRINDDR